MPTLIQREYKNLLRRQEKIEKELGVVKEILRRETNDEQIRPSVLRRWERMSRQLDSGRGRSFSSITEMKKWLKSL